MNRSRLTPEQVKEITDILQDAHKKLTEIDELVGMTVLPIIGAVNTEIVEGPVGGGFERLVELLRQFSVSELKIIDDYEKEILSRLSEDGGFWEGFFGCPNS